MSVQSAAAALPMRQTLSSPKQSSIMLMVRRAILRISCAVGGLGNMSWMYVDEMRYHWLPPPHFHLTSESSVVSESKRARLFVQLPRVPFCLAFKDFCGPRTVLDARLDNIQIPHHNMAESNSFIDSSFVLIGTDQSQALPPSRPPTVTSDTTFPSSISTPTSPLDSNVSFVGTLEVVNRLFISFRLI